MTNADLLEETYQTALGSEGSATKELGNYQQGLQYSVDTFKASLEELSTTALSSDLAKGFVDFGNESVQAINDVVNSLGGLGTALTALSGVAFFKNLDTLKGIGRYGDLFKSFGQFAGLGGSSANEASARSMAEMIKGLGDISMKDLNTLFKSNGVTQEFATMAMGMTQFSEASVGAETAAKNVAAATKGLSSGMSAGVSGVSSLGLAFQGLGSVISANIAPIVAIGVAIAGVVALYKKVNEFSSSMEKASESISEYTDAQTELDSIDSELEDVQSQVESMAGEYNISLEGTTDIDEMIAKLEASDKLSLTDKADLETLKAETQELERQRAVQEKVADNAQETAKAEARETLELKDTKDYAEEIEHTYGNYEAPSTYRNEGLIKATQDNIDKLDELKEARKEALSEDINADVSGYDRQIEEIDSTVADSIESLNTLRDAFSETDQEYKDITDLMDRYANIDASTFQKQMSAIESAFSDTSTTSTIKDQLMAMAELEGGSFDATSALNSLGVSLSDLGIIGEGARDTFNQYFDELIESAKEAEESAGTLEGTLSSVETAFESANQDADYDSMSDYISQAKDLYEAGKIGVDDFKEVAQYLSPDKIVPSEDDYNANAYVEAWENAQDQVKRYFDSENPLDSAQNAIDDLVSNGLAKENADDYDWTKQFQSSADAAEAFDLSIEATEDVLHNLESYGFEFDNILWSGEALSSYSNALEGLRTTVDGLEGSDRKYFDSLLEGFDSDYEKYQDDISSLDNDAVVNIEFVYDLATIKSELQEIQNSMQTEGGTAENWGAYNAALLQYRDLMESNENMSKALSDSTYKEMSKQFDNAATQLSSNLSNLSDEQAETYRQQEAAILSLQGAYLDAFNAGDAIDWESFLGTEEYADAISNIGDLIGETGDDVSETIAELCNMDTGTISSPEFDASETDKEISDLQQRFNMLKDMASSGSGMMTMNFDTNIDDVAQSVEAVAENGDITYHVGTDVDVDEAESAIRETLDLAEDEKVTVVADLEANDNMTETLDEAEEKSDSLDGKEITEDAEVDDEASGKLDDIENKSNQLDGKVVEEKVETTQVDNSSSDTNNTNTTTEQTVTVKYVADTSALASATSGLDTTATITYTADTATAAGMVSSLLNQQGTIFYTANTAMLPTTFQSGTAIVNYTAETASLPTSFPNVQRTVDYIADISALPTSFSNVSRTVNYTANTAGLPTSFSTITRTVQYKATGDTGGSQQLNGTAHANGTTKGYSYASGNLDDSSWIKSSWETNTGEVALTGEIGQELVVDPYTNRWFTVGDEGAEFAYIPKGAVVFNAEQTKELFENGFTDSYGYSYLTGTSYAPGGGGPKLKSSSSTSKTSTSSSGGGGTSSNKSSGGSSSKKNTGTSKKSGKSKTKSALEKFQDWFSQLFDWIEIKLERQTDKISRYITKAENALNEGSYGTSATNYINAIASTSTQIGYEDTAYDKYIKEANKTLKKGQSTGAINSKQAKTIRKRVKNGSMNISEYSDKQQEVIKDYMEWYDKALECSDALNELHGQIQQYIQDLKDMRDAQRDATISTAETYTTIATSGYAYSSGMQNDQLSYQNTQLGKQNTAYETNTTNVNADVKSVAKKATSSMSTKDSKSAKKKHKSYKKALKTAQKNIKARKKISSSTLKTIKKYNMEVYNNCYAYNLQLDELETTRLEEATNYASTSADIFANTAEKYSNKNEQAENNISLYQLQASNATSASSANSYLDKVAKQYDTMVSNDNAAVSDYASSMKSAQKTIKNNSGKGSKYSNASSSTKKNIKKYIQKAKDAAAAGKYIPSSTISKLAEYYSKGYVSRAFYESCVDYNNALAYKEEAEAQLAIDKETAKQEKAAIGTEKFENVEQEYTNKINSNQAATSLLEAQQATKETRGVALTADDYNTLISQSKELQQIYEEEITALDKQVQSNLSSGYWTKSSQEYLDAINAIDNYKVELEDCKTAQEEYNNALAQLPYDTIEEALELLDSIANYNESVAKLRTALGEDLDESDYLTQMEDIQNKIDKYTEEMEQAWEDYNKALADVDQVYGGQTADKWLAAYNDYATAINEAKVDLEDLKDELRDDVYWRTFDRAHDSCERFSNVLEGLMDLIDSDMYFDADGNITEYGIAQVANLVSEYENARKEVENYSNDIENLNNLYAEGYYTTEEFEEKLNELQESMLDSAKSMKSAMDDLVDMYKDMAQSELDSLLELISKRNDALDKKKEYYDYDKTISDKNKDIQSLQAQIAALEGVNKTALSILIAGTPQSLVNYNVTMK